jgi:hypothetical protein
MGALNALVLNIGSSSLVSDAQIARHVSGLLA